MLCEFAAQARAHVDDVGGFANDMFALKWTFFDNMTKNE